MFSRAVRTLLQGQRTKWAELPVRVRRVATSGHPRVRQLRVTSRECWRLYRAWGESTRLLSPPSGTVLLRFHGTWKRPLGLRAAALGPGPLGLGPTPPLSPVSAARDGNLPFEQKPKQMPKCLMASIMDKLVLD